MRNTLTPYIVAGRDTHLLQLPLSFHAIQALELLSVHAPLGVLPLQTANPLTLAVGRGQINAATRISESIAFPMVMKRILQEGVARSFEMTDTWLWLSLCAAEANIALEDESTKRPASLTAARDLAEALMASESHELWQRSLDTRDAVEVLGRLALCDRLARLGRVHDALGRMNSAMEVATQEPNLDLVESLVEELKYYLGRVEAIDMRYDALICEPSLTARLRVLTRLFPAIISSASRGMSTTWLTYRRIRQRCESSKVVTVCLRMLIATAYFPGTALALPGLPDDLAPMQRISYAISRASNPPDIMAFVLSSSNPAALAIREWSKLCEAISEQVLVAVAQLGGDLIPLDDVVCIAVENAKVLMEAEAGRIAMSRSGRAIHRSPWWQNLRPVSQILRGMGMLSPSSHGEESEDGWETIPNGCSTLVASMVCLAAEMASTGERQSTNLTAPPLSSSTTNHDAEPHTHTQARPYSNGNHLSHGLEQSQTRVPMPSHQQYMDTSDRWMASNHDQRGLPLPHFPQTEVNAEYPPTPVDLLVSEMFNYSYHPQATSQYGVMVDDAGEGGMGAGQQMAWGMQAMVPGQAGLRES